MHQVSVILGQEGVERFRKVRRVDKPLMQILRELLLVNPIKEECATDTAYIFGNHRIFGNRRLRPLSRNGSIDGKDDAAVGLFEIEIQSFTRDEQAVALFVTHKGCIYAHTVTFEVKVIHLFCPKAISVSLVTSRIGGEGPLSDPLYTVQLFVEQEGDTQFREECVRRVGSERVFNLQSIDLVGI